MRGLGKGLRRGGFKSPIRTYSHNIKDLSIDIVDPGSGIGYGGTGVFRLAQGVWTILGAVAYIQFSSVSVGLSDTFDGDFGIGRALNSDGVLSGNDIEIIDATPFSPAVNKVTPIIRGQMIQSMAGRSINSETGGDWFRLNVIIDDTSISANSTLIANGTLHLLYTII